ncbi:putative multicopper oxidase [Corynebacterium mustelae]|uniref:Multicopper oxidase CueO n=1 Tax=Corynebacterium mustelae TaxID=571915 RepID=A0A0G3H0S3_9CORY|nr:multicopper oxidase domain-containing protein [Corynebacterium mustelae]AKK05423.1 putative multicopper oxidase [Corynebacterium mustelae]
MSKADGQLQSNTRFNRRQFLAAGLVTTASAGLALSGCAIGKNNAGSATTAESFAPTSARVPRGWDGKPRPLPIPPLAEFSMVEGRKVFSLTAKQGQSEILPGVSTTTWGFNGSMLGPTIRMSRGDNVDLRFENTLPDVTAVHCHGMLLPAEMDGGPHSAIPSGKVWTSSFTVEQPAATLWYHPHPHGETGVQAYRGLAGMIVLDDDISSSLDLPNDYGVDDIPVVIMDANFTDTGQLDETFDNDLGLQGDVPHINGITNPVFQATTRRLRLRLLNGSNMRFYNISTSDSRQFYVIASDSGLLEAPQPASAVTLGPGERTEIVIDVDPGEEFSLMSIGFADNLGVPEDEYSLDFKLKDVLNLLLIKGPKEGAAKKVPELPKVLDPSAAAPVAVADAIERNFELNTFEINGQSMDMNRVDVVIDHSEPEVWVVTNGNSDWIHNFHIHNCAFKVLEASETTVNFDTYGWKDTVTIPPGVTLKLGVIFGQYRDNHYPYMYHCHMLFHEDQGMMGQFMLVNKGQLPELDTDFTRGISGIHNH